MVERTWFVSGVIGLLVVVAAPGLPASSIGEKEATFEETRDFILRRTGTVWEDGVGGAHRYTLTFAGKKLRLTHRYSSKFEPGFYERAEVELRAIDPGKVARKEEVPHLLFLTATDGEAKVAVETTYDLPVDGKITRKSMQRDLQVPGSNENSVDDRAAMNGRLQKAWAHLIRLAGGRPSREEPF